MQDRPPSDIDFARKSLRATHLIVEFYGACNLQNTAGMRTEMVAAAENAGAKVLDSSFHKFGKNLGVTGVVLLAESHISIHTWPEFSYAAIDVFMCGVPSPEIAVQHLHDYFRPNKVKTKTLQRGL